MEPAIISFFTENEFTLENQEKYTAWIKTVITSEGKKPGELTYIFCDDDYLLNLNRQFLDHDTLTDIISFDNSVGKIVHGEIYISTERVKENSAEYNVSFEEELRRVIIHGVLHLCGYKDKSPDEAEQMRRKEEEKMQLFHVEQS